MIWGTRIKSKKIILKLFLSFFFTAILSVALIASSSYIWLRQKSIADINNATRLSLYNIHTNFSGVLDSANKIAFEVFKNSSTTSLLLHKNDDDYVPLLTLTQYIDNLMLTNPWLLSATIYDGKTCVYNNSSDVYFKETDASISKLLKTSRILTPSQRIVISNKKKYNLITIIYYEATYDSGAIIININANALHNFIYPSYIKNNEDVFIVNGSGNILLHNDINVFMKNISQDGYLNQIMSSTSDFGSIERKISGDKYMINYVKDRDTNISVISLTSYSKITSELSKSVNLILILCLAVFLFILLISFYVSKKLYAPINTVFSNIRSLVTENPVPQEKQNDLQLLSDTILHTIEKLNNFEKGNRELAAIQRDAFIKDTLNSESPISAEDLLKHLETYKLSDVFSHPFCVVVLRIDNHKKFISDNTKEAIELQLVSISSLIKDVLQDFGKYYSVEMDSRHITLFIGHADALTPDFVPSLSDYLQHIKASIQGVLKLSVTIGVSDISNDISLIRRLYTQAFGLTNYRLVLGQNMVISQRELNIHDSVRNSKQYVSSLLAAVKNPSVETYRSTVHELYESCKNSNYESILKLLALTSQSILNIPSELGLTAIEDNDYLHLYTLVSEFENYSDVEIWFMDIYNKTTLQISSVIYKGTEDFISKTLEYIKNNFTNEMISANYVADIFSITPQYFSRIFKDYSGMGFPEYLNNLRLEMAKEIILSNPKVNLDIVCQQVGYTNKKYFSTLFKNKYGVLPSKLKQL